MKRQSFLSHLAALMPVLPLVLAMPSALASPDGPAADRLAQTLQPADQPTAASPDQFAQSPVLLSTSAAASQRSQTGFYYFSIRLPDAAGRPMAAVTIAPLSRRSTRFDLNETEAFLGTPDAAAAPVALQSVVTLQSGVLQSGALQSGSSAAASNAVQITFAQPIQPGSTVTVGLKPSQTPERRRYEFGITAIPAANLSEADPTAVALGQPEFLGNGEVSFRGQRYRDYPFWWRNDGLLSTWSEGDHRVLFWDLPPEFDPRLRRRD